MTPADILIVLWSDIPPAGRILIVLCSIVLGVPLLLHLFS